MILWFPALSESPLAKGLETKTLDWVLPWVLGSNWARFQGSHITATRLGQL
jgi:hypothetical protein